MGRSARYSRSSTQSNDSIRTTREGFAFAIRFDGLPPPPRHDRAPASRLDSGRLRGGDDLQAARILGIRRLHRPDEPGRRAVSPRRPRARRREERVAEDLPESHDQHVHRRRRPPDRHAQLLGPRDARPGRAARLRPGLSGRVAALRLRSLHAQPAGRRRPALAHGGRRVLGHVPGPARRTGRDDRRLRRQRPALATSGGRKQLDGGRRGGSAARGLVPAVPEPRDGGARLRSGREALRVGRRRRELQRRGLGPARRHDPGPGQSGHVLHAGQPLRRSSVRPRNAADEADGPRRSAPQPVPASPSGRGAPSQRRDSPGGPGDGRSSPGQSSLLELRSERAAHPGVRTAQSVPHDRAPRNQRGLRRRRGLEQLGGAQSHPRPLPGAQLRLALLRGKRGAVHRPQHLPVAGPDRRPAS